MMAPTKRPAKTDLAAFCRGVRDSTAHLQANGARWVSFVALARHLNMRELATIELAMLARDQGLVTTAADHSVCLTAKGHSLLEAS